MDSHNRTPVNAWSFLRAADEVASELLRDNEADLPPHLQDASRRAQELGLDLDALLAVDAKDLDRAAFPTPDCVTPTEVESYWVEEAELAKDRREHIEGCEFCLRLIRAAKPTPEQFERFLDEVGSLFGRAALRGRAASVSDEVLP